MKEMRIRIPFFLSLSEHPVANRSGLGAAPRRISSPSDDLEEKEDPGVLFLGLGDSFYFLVNPTRKRVSGGFRERLFFLKDSKGKGEVISL